MCSAAVASPEVDGPSEGTCRVPLCLAGSSRLPSTASATAGVTGEISVSPPAPAPVSCPYIQCNTLFRVLLGQIAEGLRTAHQGIARPGSKSACAAHLGAGHNSDIQVLQCQVISEEARPDPGLHQHGLSIRGHTHQSGNFGQIHAIACRLENHSQTCLVVVKLQLLWQAVPLNLRQ